MLVTYLRRRQVQHGTGTQRWPDFPGHCIKTETGHARRMTARLQRKRLTVPMHQIGECAVLDHHALGLAGGAGGVNHVRKVLLIKALHLGIAVGVRMHVGLLDVQLSGLAHQSKRRVLGQHQTRRAVLQQVSDALGRVHRIYRHIGGTRLEYGEHGDQPLRPTVQAQRDPLVRHNAQADQVMREAIGLLVELGIRQGVAILNQRRALWRSGNLRFNLRVHGETLRERLPGRIEIFQQMPTLVCIEDRNVVQRQRQGPFQRLNQLLQGILHPARNTLGAHALHGQHVQVEVLAQVIDAEGQRVVAAYITAEHPHALPEPFAVVRLDLGAVAVVEQGAEQRRTRGHAAATLSEYQGCLFMGDQRSKP